MPHECGFPPELRAASCGAETSACWLQQGEVIVKIPLNRTLMQALPYKEVDKQTDPGREQANVRFPAR